LFCSEYRPKIKGEHLGLSIGDVAKKRGAMWNNTAADDEQPYEKKAAKLKGKYERILLPTELKENPMQGESGWSRLKRERKRRKGKMMRKMKKMKKKRKMKMMKMIMNKLVLVQFFFLSIKHLTPLYTTHSF
jgi:high mobility group protein B1